MESTHTFVCPSCGASITAQGDQAEVRCEFCGTTVIVPEELRSRPSMPPSPPPAPPQVIVVETPPTVVYEQQAPMPMPPLARRRRRAGCGCGCLTPLLGLLFLAAVLAGILYTQQPAVFSQFVNQVQAIAASFSNTPRIISFTATPNVVTSGGTVVVVWITTADTVRLDQVTAQGTQTLSSLPAAGEHTFTVANETGEITFRLTAVKNGQQATSRAVVTVRRR